MGRQVSCIQDFIALLVDNLALVIGDIVVFKQLLAHVKVACFHLALRTLNAARHDTRLNRLAIGHLEAIHDRLHTVTRKDAHQRIIQA